MPIHVLVKFGLALAAGAGLAAFVYFRLRRQRQKQQPHREQRQRSTKRSTASPQRSIAPPQPDNACLICRDDLTVPLEILPCNHHRWCVTEWFLHRMACPHCNATLSSELRAEYRDRLMIPRRDL